MNTRPDNPESREPKAGELPADVARLGAMLNARGRRQREALSSEALERIAAMSDLQLPIVGADEPVVIARIETTRPSWWATPRVWRVAAAVAVLAGVGAATFFAVRAFRSDAPGMPYAHPTVEHFVPLFVTLGAATDPAAAPTTVIDGYFFGLAKRSFQVA